MRTKALFLTAALGVASIATSMAQVYSVNAVGYVNVTVPLTAPGALPTYAILANPLNGTNNNIGTILPSVPDGTQVYLFDAVAGWKTETFLGGVWDPNTSVLPPGLGFFISLDPAFAAPGPVTVTFVGEVPQGNLVNPIPNGFSLRGSMVPQAGQVTQVLGLTPKDGDQLFKFNRATQQYATYTYVGSIDPQNPWDPSQPTVEVGEGFFMFNASGSAYNWQRNFTVQ